MKITHMKQGKMDRPSFPGPQRRLWKMTSRASVALVDAEAETASTRKNFVLSFQEKGIPVSMAAG